MRYNNHTYLILENAAALFTVLCQKRYLRIVLSLCSDKTSRKNDILNELKNILRSVGF